MAITVHIEVDREFEVNCPFDRCFDVVADVPESAGHFPKLDTLYDMGENAYCWEMEKIGIDAYSLQTTYTCAYKDDRAKGTVTWSPADGGDDNARVKGKWQLKKLGPKKTKLRLTTTADLDIPLPGLLKMVVSPLVSREFHGLIEQYIENLTATFEGR